MPANKKITEADWKEAVVATGGVVSLLATRLGVHRSTIYRYLNAHPELKTTIRDQRETCKDAAEGNIHAAPEEKNVHVSMWYLTSKANDRGYGAADKPLPKAQPIGNVLLCLPDDGRDLEESDAEST